MHKSQEAEHRKSKKRSFLQFFCFSFPLSLSSKHKERAHSHDLPLQVSFASLGSTTRRAAAFFFFFFFLLLLFIYLPTLPKVPQYIVCLPEKYKYRCKVRYVAIRGHPPSSPRAGVLLILLFHRYMYLSKANMCLPGAKSWIRTRALHSVDGGTRERSYENVF